MIGAPALQSTGSWASRLHLMTPEHLAGLFRAHRSCVAAGSRGVRTPRTPSRPGGWLLPRAHPGPHTPRCPRMDDPGSPPSERPGAGRDGDPRIFLTGSSPPGATPHDSPRPDAPRRWVFARFVPAVLAFPFRATRLGWPGERDTVGARCAGRASLRPAPPMRGNRPGRSPPAGRPVRPRGRTASPPGCGNTHEHTDQERACRDGGRRLPRRHLRGEGDGYGDRPRPRVSRRPDHRRHGAARAPRRHRSAHAHGAAVRRNDVLGHLRDRHACRRVRRDHEHHRLRGPEPGAPPPSRGWTPGTPRPPGPRRSTTPSI